MYEVSHAARGIGSGAEPAKPHSKLIDDPDDRKLPQRLRSHPRHAALFWPRFPREMLASALLAREHEPVMGTPTTCHECGHEQAGPRPEPPPLSWVALWPVAVVLVGLVALGFALRAGAESSSGRISWGLRFIGSSPVTIDELTALAAGNPGVDLYEDLRKRREADAQFGWFPDSRFEFGYTPCSNLRHSFRTVGWPLRVWSSTVGAMFDDPFSGTGFRPLETHPDFQPDTANINPAVVEGRSVPVPRWAWWAGTLQFAPPPEERGGRLETRSIFLSGLGATLGLVALAWLLGGAAGIVLDVRRRRNGGPPIGRWVRRWSATLAAVVIVVGTAMNVRSGTQVTPDYALEGATNAIPAPTITVAEFLEHRTDPGRNRWLAGRLLESLRLQEEALRAAMGESKQRPLALSSRLTTDWVTRHAWTGWSATFPLVSTQVWTYIPPATDADGIKELAPYRVAYDGRRITLHRSPGSNLDDTVSVDLPGLGTLSLGIFVLAGTCRGATRLVRRLESSRRRSRNECIACGHPLPRTAVAAE